MAEKVDVIILSWNRAKDTIAAIESALSQQGVEVRVLVVDQGSSAENLAKLREAVAPRPTVTLRELGCNVGVARGRNIASRMGGAPYIVALDNDAVFPDQNVLVEVVRRFERDLALGAIAFRILNFFTGEDDEMCWDYPRVPRACADQEFLVSRFVGAGHAMRREAFIAAGEYDESLFFGGEERDLSYRVLNLGYRIKYIPDLLILHKVDPEVRVRWQDGRYYYIVRNGLYTDFKFGAPMWKLARTAAAVVVKGICNRMAGQAIRSIFDATVMCVRFARSRSRSPIYQLQQDAKRYIESCEHSTPESIWIRVRRQFQKLPGGASS